MALRSVQICSVDDLRVELPEDIREFLGKHYSGQDGHDDALDDLIHAMKRPPATTICRVNQITSTVEDVKATLTATLHSQPHLRLEKHELSDVLCIVPRDTGTTLEKSFKATKPDGTEKQRLEFTDPGREGNGWPMTHRVVICDRFCGEAVLRGSDIFVRGILVADAGIIAGDEVAVYADIRSPKDTSLSKGSHLDRYKGTCVYLGLGQAACGRAHFFIASEGLGVFMSKDPRHRVGPCAPPFSGMLQDKAMLQNLPSILVGHALDPRPNETILDMCAAPGGKSAHLASLVGNQATIISCDKSRKKVLAARDLFIKLGATCITPLALDATKCVDADCEGNLTVRQILDVATVNDSDKLKKIKSFPPQSFDRILLDPPCSALGLRPKLFIDCSSLNELQKHAEYQRKFVSCAVTLLRVGGTLSYSTCTINPEENEAMVRCILDEFPCLKSIPIQFDIGKPGLEGFGLSDTERSNLRRFEPHGDEGTMGFFVALFRKVVPHLALSGTN